MTAFTGMRLFIYGLHALSSFSVRTYRQVLVLANRCLFPSIKGRLMDVELGIIA